MLAVCLAAVLLFAIGSIAVYKQSASHSTEVLSKTGSRGEEVRQIQTKLKSKGIYSGSVDGIYGTLTKDAVKKFQNPLVLLPTALRARKHCRHSESVLHPLDNTARATYICLQR